MMLILLIYLNAASHSGSHMHESSKAEAVEHNMCNTVCTSQKQYWWSL